MFGFAVDVGEVFQGRQSFTDVEVALKSNNKCNIAEFSVVKVDPDSPCFFNQHNIESEIEMQGNEKVQAAKTWKTFLEGSNSLQAESKQWVEHWSKAYGFASYCYEKIVLAPI